jgi:hypothetical protein
VHQGTQRIKLAEMLKLQTLQHRPRRVSNCSVWYNWLRSL